MYEYNLNIQISSMKPLKTNSRSANEKKAVELLDKEMRRIRGEPPKEEGVIHKNSVMTNFPSTVIRTNLLSDLKEKIELLLAPVYSKPAQEQMWSDPDFKPNQDSIFKEADMAQMDPKVQEEITTKVKWVRTDYITSQPEQHGFFDAQEGMIDGHQISQGETLDDRWLLNGLSLIAAEERQFENMTSEHDSYLVGIRKKHGIYVFRFFKGGEPIFVVVDDHLPCTENPDGSLSPYFARCANPYLFWVSLAEKAYAKLHGRYFALHGGTTDEALEDLTGVVVENCFIDNGAMTDPKTLFTTLNALCIHHAVLGAKLDLEMFPKAAANEKSNKYSLAKASGIWPCHQYSILDVRQVKVVGSDGVSQMEQLVRLQCPWADAPEWNGKASDQDTQFWTPEVKDAFNSQDIGGQGVSEKNLTSNRYTHDWSRQDGIFCMRIQDFMEHFSQLTICRDFPDTYFGIKYESRWSPLKGFVAQNPKYKNILQDNKQFIFTQEATTSAHPVSITIVLQQEDPRLNQQVGGPYKNARAGIGLLVMNLGRGLVVRQNEKVTVYDANKQVAFRTVQPFRTTVCTFHAAPGKYAVIPLIDRMTDNNSRFTLKMYFGCEDSAINFHNDEKPVKVISYIGSGPGVGTRNKLWSCGSVKGGDNLFNKRVMTPYLLDTILNKPSKPEKAPTKSVAKKTLAPASKEVGTAPPKKVPTATNPTRSAPPSRTAKPSLMALNKKDFELMAPFYEDNAVGGADSEFKLMSNEKVQLKENERLEALQGFDQEDMSHHPDYVKKLSQQQQARLTKVKEEVAKEIETEVDFSYYYMNNKSLHALFPILETKMFLGATVVNLAGNAIDDEGVVDLIDCLEACHNTSLRVIDLQDTKITQTGLKSIIEMMRNIQTITEVRFDINQIHPEVVDRLDAACRKNQALVDSQNLLDNMVAAGQRRDKFDQDGVNYYIE